MWPRRALSASFAVLALGATSVASAGEFDLDDEEKIETPAEKREAAVVTVRPHAYTLAECLALADRNHPNVWAARARLAGFHAQLDEAKWTPYSFWSASASTGVLPQIGGTPFYNAVPRNILNQGVGASYQPFLQFNLRGGIPLYTFGKIDSIRRAAEAQVRYGEWDMEAIRQEIRMDVRRAYYGLMLAHDALYIADDVLGKLNKALNDIVAKLEAGDTRYEDADRLRLEIYRDELLARVAEARRGETFASAALRFLTGVQTAFEIPDEPLKRPDVPLGPVVRYLTAARLFRADVNRARAGVAGRRAFVDHQRAQLFPNIALGVAVGYAIAPSATPQNTAWIGDPFNGPLGAGALINIDWPLDLLPRSARLALAESQLEETRALERLALGGVALQVENVYATVVEAKTREETWDRAEHRAKNWISSVQDAIDLGTKDEKFILEPLRIYVLARANHAQSLMDFNVALADLARVSGWELAAPKS